MTTAAGRINPYVGPRPFSGDEVVPAREREVLELRRTLISARILVLHSPSGAGKTSLIEAANGLRRAMEDRQFRVYPSVRLHHPAPPELRGAANRYELSALRTLLVSDGDPDLAELAALGLSGYLERQIAADATAHDEDGAESKEAAPRTRRGRELLIFDQFEEVLSTDPSDVEGRATFFDRLAEVLDDPFRWALFLIREDFLGALAPWAKRLPTHLNAHYRIDLLRPEAARVAIEAPAAAQGVHFAADALEHLIRELCRTTIQGPDGRQENHPGLWIEPVHLQVVCRRLWSQLAADETLVSLATVQALGDVDTSLAAFYREQVAAVAHACGVSERRLRDWVSTRLISARGLRLQVVQGDDRGEAMPGRVLEALESAYLVRAEERRGVRWFELAHDRLVEPVRRDNETWEQANLHPMQLQAGLWHRESERPEYLLSDEALGPAATWAAAHADNLTDREEMFLRRSRERAEYRARERQDAARLAIEQQRRLLEQFRRVRSLRLAALLLAILVLGAVVVAVLAWTKSEEAQRQTRAATARRDEVNALVKSLSESVAPLLGDLPGTVGLQRELYALIRRTLAERSDDATADPTHLRNRFVQHVNLGKFELAEGSLEDGIADLHTALALADAVEHEFPGDLDILRRKSVILVSLGVAEMRRDNLAGAKQWLTAAVTPLAPLDDGGELPLAIQRNLAAAYQRLGELEVRTGAIPDGRAHFQRSVELARALAQRDPEDVESRRLMFGALLRLGSLEGSRGDRSAALDRYRSALVVAEETAARYPLNPQVLRDTSLVCDELGVLMADHDRDAARGYFERSLAVAEILARAEADGAQTTFDLIVAHLQFRLLGAADDAQLHLPPVKLLLETMEDRGLFADDPNLIRARADALLWEQELAASGIGTPQQGDP